MNEYLSSSNEVQPDGVAVPALPELVAYHPDSAEVLEAMDSLEAAVDRTGKQQLGIALKDITNTVDYQLSKVSHEPWVQKNILNNKDIHAASETKIVRLYDPQTHALNAAVYMASPQEDGLLLVVEATPGKEPVQWSGSDPKRPERTINFNAKTGEVKSGIAEATTAEEVQAWNSVLYRSVPVDEELYLAAARVFDTANPSYYLVTRADKRRVWSGLHAAVAKEAHERKSVGIV